MTDFAADPLVRADSSAVIDRLKGVPRGVRLTLRMLLKLKVGNLKILDDEAVLGQVVKISGLKGRADLNSGTGKCTICWERLKSVTPNLRRSSSR